MLRDLDMYDDDLVESKENEKKLMGAVKKAADEVLKLEVV